MISVALCTYNGEKFIKEQLDSILNQTMLVDEIVICDDGSTDKTINILQSYQKNETKIRVFSNKKNIGTVKNFEKAISLTSGDIIFLSDQDDIWNNDKVEKMHEVFVANPKYNVLFSNAVLIDDENSLFTSKTLFDVVNLTDKTKKYISDGFGFELLNIENRVTGATMAVRREFINKLLPFQPVTKIFHDEYIAVAAFLEDCIGIVSQCSMSYRIHATQLMGLKSWIEQSPDIDFFRFREIKSDYFLFFDENNGLFGKKLDFTNTRKKIIKSPIGLLMLFFSVNKYKTQCGKYANKFIVSDLNDFIQLNKRRIKRLFNALRFSNNS